MSQAAGERVILCPFCGKHYKRTNWMIRRSIRAKDGTLLRDTHRIACYRKLKENQP